MRCGVSYGAQMVITHTPSERRYRAFVSYSHRDQAICDHVVGALELAGLLPRSDANLSVGPHFDERIQNEISHAHVFLPILSEASQRNGWVLQEIGYALALRVPCVPICVGTLPDGMLAMSQAIAVDNSLTGLTERLGAVDFEDVVESAFARTLPAGTTTEPEERAVRIAEYANEARVRLGPVCVRIGGGLSSFSLPDHSYLHPSWTARYGNQQRPPYSYQVFRAERIALERHASRAGVRMIVNRGLNVDAEYGEGATRTRLCILRQFLESLTVAEDAVEVAVVDDHTQPARLTLSVGDWFCAESLAGRPVRGVLQTVFVTHAPSVTRHNQDFDRELRALLEVHGIPAARSRQAAIERLGERIAQLPAHPAWSC